jgi:hypothetical protein
LALAPVSAAAYLGEHLLAYMTEVRARALETITAGRHTEEGFADVLSDEQPDGSLASRITIDGVETLPLGSVANAVTVFCNETGEIQER